jgi:hypothetical protein
MPGGWSRSRSQSRAGSSARRWRKRSRGAWPGSGHESQRSSNPASTSWSRRGARTCGRDPLRFLAAAGAASALGRSAPQATGPRRYAPASIPCEKAAPVGVHVSWRGPLWEGCEWQGTPLAGGCTYTLLNRMYAPRMCELLPPGDRETPGARIAGQPMPNGAPREPWPGSVFRAIWADAGAVAVRAFLALAWDQYCTRTAPLAAAGTPFATDSGWRIPSLRPAGRPLGK